MEVGGYWTKDVQEGLTMVPNRTYLDKESREPVLRRQG